MRFPRLRPPSVDPRRLVRSKLLWTMATLLLVYAVCGFLLAPWLIGKYLPSFAQERLERRASVEKVRINPFTLTFEASGFYLQDKGDKALIAFKRLYVDVELSGLFRRAWTFREIRLEGANLGLEVDRELRLNLVEVLRRLLKAPEPDAPPARVLVEHLVIDDGRIGITDLSGELRADAAFAPISLELTNLSTLADRQGRYTLNARLPAGGTLDWKGVLSLEPIASSGELSIKGLKLESLWRFRRAGLNLARPGGDLGIAGHYEFHFREGHGTLLMNGVHAEAADLTLAVEGDKEPLLALRTIRLTDASFAFPKNEIAVGKLVLADGTLNAIVAESGVPGWQRITAPAKAGAAAPVTPAPSGPAAPPDQPWRIRVPAIAIENVAINYEDRSAKPALAVRAAALNATLGVEVGTHDGVPRTVVDGIEVALKTLSAAPAGTEARFASLDALTLAGGRIDTQERSIRAKSVRLSRADVALEIGPSGPEGLIKAFSPPPPPGAAEPKPQPADPWRVQVGQVGIDKLAVRYDDKSTRPGVGLRVQEASAGFSLDASTGGDAARVVAGDVEVAIDRFRVDAQGGDAPLATLDSFRLASGRVDTGERTVTAKSIALSGGGVRIVRGPGGAMGLIDAFAPKQTATAPRARAAKAETSRPWRYRADAIALKRFGIALADAAYKPAIAYDIDIASVSAANVDPASRKPIAFTAEMRVGKNGTVKGDGTLQQDFAGASARLELARLPLEPLQPLLAKYATLDLKSGALSGKARAVYQSAGKPALSLRGDLAVDDALVTEAGSGERFLAWKTLAADGAELTLSPDKLVIREVRAIEPGAKLIIAKDRTVNLTKVVKPEAAGEAATAKPASAAKPPTNDAPAFPYDIATIRVEKGTLDFADLSLVLPFATQVQALQGAIVGLSSDAQARAQLKLAGQVDQYGEARADGSLLPRDPVKFMDITARFDNVELRPFSPYSATFAGRRIAEGRLALVLEYKVVNSQLAGENRVVLRDFKLGERVEAPGAVNLPLDLAIALLKDSEGRINIEVPVRGNVGDPEFVYSKVIWSAIVNVLTRIVTAPFRALGALFGKGDADAHRTVSFAPGSDTISPPQREGLDALAKALKSRPQLKLVVKGPYDASEDARALKRRQARLDLARALDAKVEAGQDPGPIAYDRADTQRALEKLLSQRGGSDALAQLEKTFAQRAGRQPDRVNPVLGLVGRGSKDVEFYEAVFDRLGEVTPLPDTAVRDLAASRAQAVIEVLGKAGINSGQVSAGGIAQVKAQPERGVTAELALEALPGA